MKLEVGSYIRYKDINGLENIAKIEVITFDEEIEENIYRLDIPDFIFEDCIIKSSNNIVDLLKEDDYLRIISSCKFEHVYLSYGNLCIKDDVKVLDYSNDFIAEIITSDYISKISYKLRNNEN